MADIDDTSTTAPVEGIHAEEVTAWFAEHVAEARPPLGFDLIAGGRSNLTYSVTDRTGARWVLRRPPLGHVLATAHDMGREHRIIAALADTAVPVPPVIGLSPDDSVNGAPFYVMAFVDGPILRNREAALTLPIEARARAADSIVDVLAEIHAVDVDAVGLGELGRRDGYIERQLKRWQGQWEKTKTRELPVIDAVHDRLAASVPEQGPATIVHGDYRLDNCILDDDGRIQAVLDWELCTLGDPLADVGQLCMYWTEPGDTLVGRPRRADDGRGLRHPDRPPGPLRRGLRPGPERDRLLHRLRLLEAGLHLRGRAQALPGRGDGRGRRQRPGRDVHHPRRQPGRGGRHDPGHGPLR